ncbi:MAG: PEP-CTERM sorting domain-containing protein [Nitrospirae bacterium]|nr:PEP-CTERM sorting domain-containing protein [Nitrospirota bacterium]
MLLCPAMPWSIPTDGGPHLWLSTDPANFDEGGAGYIGPNADTWTTDSYITTNHPSVLYIYNADNRDAATDIRLLLTVHNGESGTITVEGTDYTSFTGTSLPSQYGGGNHGIYDPHDGRFAIADLGFDLDSEEFNKAAISFEGFSEVHFDVFSSNNFWNPPSHDATGTHVPEPGTILLMGTGLLGLVLYGRKRFKK